jgi:hypothetical protein
MLVFAAPLSAQAPAPAAPPAAPVAEPVLVFDREVFNYEGSARRDPFSSLIGKAGLGPRFEDLAIKGIILSGPQSVVLLTDASAKKVYRVRRGDVVGNARVVEIAANHVIFAVENFGQYRQEILELKRKPEGAQG